MACAATGALTHVTQHCHDSVYDINSHCYCQPLKYGNSNTKIPNKFKLETFRVIKKVQIG